MYADIARPLFALLVIFEWTEECEVAYEKLKQALVSAPILGSPDWNKIFHVHIDASNFAIGCILAQAWGAQYGFSSVICKPTT